MNDKKRQGGIPKGFQVFVSRPESERPLPASDEELEWISTLPVISLSGNEVHEITNSHSGLLKPLLDQCCFYFALKLPKKDSMFIFVTPELQDGLRHIDWDKLNFTSEKAASYLLHGEELTEKSEGNYSRDRGLLPKLKPVFAEDQAKWDRVSSSFDPSHNAFIWYAGAGHDFETIKKLANQNIPQRAKSVISPHCSLICSDYDKHLLKQFKRLKGLDGETKPFGPWDELQPEIIPLTLFCPDELDSMREKGTGHFHSCMTDSVITDDQWHITCVKIRGIQPFLYAHMENLLFWEAIVERFDLKIDAFCALQMGGKSGSWDKSPHMLTGSKLARKIMDSRFHRPKLWIGDETDFLDNRVKNFTRLDPEDKNNGYGVPHYWTTGWKQRK